MKSIFFVVFLSVLLLVQFGCSGNNANSANDANANAPAESPFAYITDANAALAEGDRLLDENQTEQAIEAYRQAVKLNPDLADAYFKLGIAYALIEAELEQAGVNVETTSNTEGKKTGPAKTNSQKAFEKAVEAYKKLLAANPKDDAAQFNLGRAYNRLNKDEQAEDAFRLAVKEKPDDTEYQTELGGILVKLAKYREALTPLKKALELDPENSRAANLLEDAEAGTKRIDFVQKNVDNKNANANANVSASVSGNSNSPASATNVGTKPTKDDPKDKKLTRPANKPN